MEVTKEESRLRQARVKNLLGAYGSVASGVLPPLQLLGDRGPSEHYIQLRQLSACNTEIYLHNECAHVGGSVHAPVCPSVHADAYILTLMTLHNCTCIAVAWRVSAPHSCSTTL